MDITYFDEPINLSTIQLNEDSYLNNYKNKEAEKLSRYNFNYSYYPKVSNNIYNAIFNYYKNMNYSKKETEFINYLNNFTFNYNDYMKNNENHIKFFIFIIYMMVSLYCSYKVLEFAVFLIINVFSVMYKFMFYNVIDNIDNNNDDTDNTDVDDNSDTDNTDVVDNVSSYVDPLSELYNCESEYLPYSDDEDKKQEDEVLEYYETEENTDIENSKTEITTKLNKITDIDEVEVYNIQTILENIVFKNITMKKIASKCNKQSIRCIRQFHNCKSLNKKQLIMAFMHTYIYRYYNNEKNIVEHKSFFNYLHSKLQEYYFKDCAKLMQDNITSDDMDDYITYYFDIIEIIIDC